MSRPGSSLPPDGLEAVAASWLARRDRGFSGAEQDSYLQWLQENPAHGAEIARLENTWRALDHLSEWRPVHSVRPNPDLLAPRAGARRRWLRSGIVAAAAVVAFAFWIGRSAPAPVSSAPVARLVQNSEVRSLADGSIVEINRGSAVEVTYTDAERRVRLVKGEAHFTVKRDAARPFIVEAGGVAVRAIGTAFNVRLSGGAVEVLVTSGKVQVDSTQALPGLTPTEPVSLAPMVEAGHRVLLPADIPAEPVPVEAISTGEIEKALAWQGLRIEFSDATLAQAVGEFNRHNRHQLVVRDPALAGVRIAGSFRADNVDGFVRLMVSALEVTADRTGDLETVLRPAR